MMEPPTPVRKTVSFVREEPRRDHEEFGECRCRCDECSKNDTPNTASSPLSGYSSYTPPENRITLTWSNLCVDVPEIRQSSSSSNVIPKVEPFGKRKRRAPTVVRKPILRNVFGIAKPGQILAIIGSSGCGKSTLLNALMGRVPRKFTVKGSIEANGATIGKSISKIAAYVQQDDVFHPNLTVGEHLWFHSKLRLSDEHYSDSDRLEKINAIVEELGLTKCFDVLIGKDTLDGNVAKKTISGGERRRLAFATQILTNPSLLCCDEATSGLDSFMAESIVHSMKHLAKGGKTVICTLHQPSSQIINLLDNVLVMHEGRVVFLGRGSDLTDYFASIGHECPDSYNPFDHVLSILSSPSINFEIPTSSLTLRNSIIREEAGEFIDNSGNFSKAAALAEIFKRDKLCKAVCDEIGRAQKRQSSAATLEARIASGVGRASTWSQYRMCIWRSWLTTVRSKQVFVMRIVSTLCLSALYSLVFANQSYDQKGARNFVGLIYQISTFAFWENMEPYAMTIPQETPIYLREQQYGLYSPAAYFIGRIIIETPQICGISLLFMSVVYWSTNMFRALSHFFVAVVIHAASGWCASGLGCLIGFGIDNQSISHGVRRALGPLISMTAGMYVNVSTLPSWIAWLRFISPKYFTNELFQINQWVHVGSLECDSASACFIDGEDVMNFYGYSTENVTRNALAIVAWMIIYRLAAFLILLFRTNRRKNEA